MRYLITLAALALLFTAAWVSYGGNDGGVPSWNVSRYASWGSGTVPWDVDSQGHGVLDGDVTRLLRMSVDRDGIWVASAGLGAVPELEEAGQPGPANLQVEPSLAGDRPPVPGLDAEAQEVVDVDSQPEGERTRVGETWLITIYCCRNDPGGAYCGKTASGVQVAHGLAACSPAWPFGTTFLVGGLELRCEDRGSAVYRWNHLDVYFEDCGNQANPKEGTGWHWLQRTGTRVEVEVLE